MKKYMPIRFFKDGSVIAGDAVNEAQLMEVGIHKDASIYEIDTVTKQIQLVAVSYGITPLNTHE
jgi:hypothetical protein